MRNCQCSTTEEVLYQGAYYCAECYVLIDDVVFEEEIDSDTSVKNRQGKFEQLLHSVQVLPWYVRYTLIDCFKRVERHFYDSDRINFINLNQLTIELLKICGYPEYCHHFKSLKTKSRVKQVEVFVRNALCDGQREMPLGCFRLEDMPLIPLQQVEPDMSKVPDSEHVYSDLTSRGKPVPR